MFSLRICVSSTIPFFFYHTPTTMVPSCPLGESIRSRRHRKAAGKKQQGSSLLSYLLMWFDSLAIAQSVLSSAGV